MRKVIIGLAALALTCASQYNPPPKYDTPEAKAGLARCLVKREATMYGAYWCSACNHQKVLFEKDAWQAFKQNYVECSERGSSEEQRRCEQENITVLPTWKFKNGKEVLGYKTLDQLAELSGCK